MVSIAPQSSALEQQQQAQRLVALDPVQSVWVSASAGSGKTTLLTERVLRLLLQSRLDNRKKLPHIVCLTYTKAAAAEMQNRVHKQLAEWATLPESALQHRLETIFHLKTTALILKKARRLFAEVLDRPDAMRIMTMHAFCQMILNRFPHEAELAPHFTLLEGEKQKQFQEQVLATFYAQVKRDAELSHALETLGATQSTTRTRQMLQQLFYNAGKWAQHFELHPDKAVFEADLRKKLSIDFTGSEDAFLQQQCTAPFLPESQLHEVIIHLQQGNNTDIKNAEALGLWLSQPEKRAETFTTYFKIFITTDDEIKKTLTKTLEKKQPALAEVLYSEAQRVETIRQQQLTIRFYHQQCAFYMLSHQLWQLYEQAKQAQAQLTYDDLILKTRDVFLKPGVAPWILYKLDGGIDHILIDEAQDTSPEQWEIIFELLEEMLAGKGAREDHTRTLFVVGDEKQSIYSFQGANHRHYLDIKARLFERYSHLPKPMMDVERIQSFRSAPAVLSFVDTVFEMEETRKGVTHAPMRHFARRTVRGYVEMWSPIKTEKKELPLSWQAPIERDDTKHAYVQLAIRIADTIGTWLREGWHIKTGDTTRPIRPDDIIILLQRRSGLLSPIIRVLKEKSIPVAGIDRMVLKEQPAVQDMISLCRFLLLPQDDLTLAEILRGPLIRISDAELFELAHARDGSLWDRLQAHVRMAAIADYLKQLLNMADTVSVFALLSQILYQPCPGNNSSGKTAMIHRLGADAIDPLEQLLSAARRFDAQNPLSLQLFVRAITQDDSELKREQSNANGEVRIMTTHGAKGLEAPIIFMPDLMRDPHKQGEQPALFWDAQGFAMAATPNTKPVAYVKRTKEYYQEAQAQEHRRLLYVALTRAADVLILCSAIKNKESEKTPWQNHCISAMQRLDAEVIEKNETTVWRYGDAQTLLQPIAPSIPAVPTHAPAPAWLTQTIEKTPQKQAFYNPSLLVEKSEPQFNPASSSFQRGRRLHRLLQLLPALPRDQQEAQALRFLQHHAHEQASHDVSEVMAVLRHAVFAELFSGAAKAEVPIIGAVMGKKFSGQIDRMLVTEKEVLVVDFKTNRPPPRKLAHVDDAYLAQMACYTALLGQLYPDKTIRAALLWTNSLTLMELDKAALARGMQILGALDPLQSSTI